MHPVLNRNLYFVKQHVGLFKAAKNYDIYDPTTNQHILQCREERLGFITKLLRFTDYKRMTPIDVQIRTLDGQRVLRVNRGVTLFTSKVKVLDEHDQPLGAYRPRYFSFSLAKTIEVLSPKDEVLCQLKGEWKSWDFRFVAGETELAKVTKKWAGIGQELFTSADNYMLEISDQVPPDNPVRQLILAAVMCIDMVLRE